MSNTPTCECKSRKSCVKSFQINWFEVGHLLETILMQGFCEVAISNQHFILRREPSEDLRLLLTKNSNCTFNIRCEVANAEGYVGPGFLTINVANSVMLISLGDYVLFLAFCRLAALPCLSHQTLQIKRHGLFI